MGTKRKLKEDEKHPFFSDVEEEPESDSDSDVSLEYRPLQDPDSSDNQDVESSESDGDYDEREESSSSSSSPSPSPPYTLKQIRDWGRSEREPHPWRIHDAAIARKAAEVAAQAARQAVERAEVATEVADAAEAADAALAADVAAEVPDEALATDVTAQAGEVADAISQSAARTQEAASFFIRIAGNIFKRRTLEEHLMEIAKSDVPPYETTVNFSVRYLEVQVKKSAAKRYLPAQAVIDQQDNAQAAIPQAAIPQAAIPQAAIPQSDVTAKEVAQFLARTGFNIMKRQRTKKRVLELFETDASPYDRAMDLGVRFLEVELKEAMETEYSAAK